MEQQLHSQAYDHRLLVGAEADEEFSRLFTRFLNKTEACSIYGVERYGKGHVGLSNFMVIRGAADNSSELIARAKQQYQMLVIDEGNLAVDGWKAVYLPNEKVLSIISHTPLSVH